MTLYDVILLLKRTEPYLWNPHFSPQSSFIDRIPTFCHVKFYPIGTGVNYLIKNLNVDSNLLKGNWAGKKVSSDRGVKFSSLFPNLDPATSTLSFLHRNRTFIERGDLPRSVLNEILSLYSDDVVLFNKLIERK